MGLLDGDLAGVFGGIMGTFYPDAQLYRAIVTPDGKGGGSETFATPETVKAQLDKTIERMVNGTMELLQSIIVLQISGGEAVARPSTDDEITAGGTRWKIATIETDPAGSYFLLGGRKSAMQAAS